jgi:hypothetical protein
MSFKLGIVNPQRNIYCYSGNTKQYWLVSVPYTGISETILQLYSLIRKGLQVFIYANVCGIHTLFQSDIYCYNFIPVTVQQ